MNPLFAETVTLLLSGEIVCPYTQEDAYEFLSSPEHREQVEIYLQRIGRAVRQTSDESGFLLVHADPESHQAKAESRRVFEEMVGHVRPLLKWISFAMKAEGSVRPIRAGDTIRESELLRAIEDSPDLARGLNELCQLKPFQNDNKQPRYRLHRILTQLEEMGYLVSKAGQPVFVATGRFSVLHDVMEFIAAHAGLTPADEGDEEGGRRMSLDFDS